MTIRRQQRQLFLIICGFAFIYFFIKFGFNQNDPSPKFGDVLDRNLIEQSKLSNHKKFFENEEDDLVIEKRVIAQPVIDSQDDKILREFLEATLKEQQQQEGPRKTFKRRRRRRRKMTTTQKPNSDELIDKVNQNSDNAVDKVKSASKEITEGNKKEETAELQKPELNAIEEVKKEQESEKSKSKNVEDEKQKQKSEESIKIEKMKEKDESESTKVEEKKQKLKLDKSESTKVEEKKQEPKLDKSESTKVEEKKQKPKLDKSKSKSTVKDERKIKKDEWIQKDKKKDEKNIVDEKVKFITSKKERKTEKDFEYDAKKVVQVTKKKIFDDGIKRKNLNKKEFIEPKRQERVRVPPTKNSSENNIKELSTEPIESSNDETARSLGNNGAAVNLPPNQTDYVKELIDNGWEKYQFNEYVSSLIPVKRKLLDFRSDHCRDIHKTYKKELPPVSVIIVFYNEAWSTLLRTIHSVIDRSPSNLINEILLVDDYSELPHLKKQLDEYIQKFSQISLLRNEKHEGLIRARDRGAIYAKSDILVFLDSHVECTKGWLEPLIERIVTDKTSIAVPTIEQINDTTFEFVPHPRSISVGGFGWDLQFRWFHPDLSGRDNEDDPIDSPTMAGGLFAISAHYFMDTGMFDPGLELWGGENLEMSFKTWMCGGRIQIIPCSHVGHVFRKNSPYDWSSNTNIFKRNNLRVANVWMDDYIKFYKQAAGFEEIDYGDISDRKELRENMKCKSFEWYLKNVYPSRSIPSEQIAYGQIENLGSNLSMCLEGSASKSTPLLNIFLCHGSGRGQYWEYNGSIYRDNYCVTYQNNELIMKHCKMKDEQQFNYILNTKQLILASNNQCLSRTKDFSLTIENCDRQNESQKWKLENLDIEKLERLRER